MVMMMKEEELDKIFVKSVCSRVCTQLAELRVRRWQWSESASQPLARSFGGVPEAPAAPAMAREEDPGRKKKFYKDIAARDIRERQCCDGHWQ